LRKYAYPVSSLQVELQQYIFLANWQKLNIYCIVMNILNTAPLLGAGSLLLNFFNLQTKKPSKFSTWG